MNPKPNEKSEAVKQSVKEIMKGQKLSVEQKANILRLAANPLIQEDERAEIVSLVNIMTEEQYEFKVEWLNFMVLARSKNEPEKESKSVPADHCDKANDPTRLTSKAKQELENKTLGFFEQEGKLTPKALIAQNMFINEALTIASQKVEVSVWSEIAANPSHGKHQGPSACLTVNGRFFILIYFVVTKMYCLHGYWPNPHTMISIESFSAETIGERLAKWAFTPYKDE